MFVCAEGGDILGFSCGGANRSDLKGYDAELWAIYVASHSQGKGLGRKLFSVSTKRLTEERFEKMILWCLKGNAPSLSFYRGLGGVDLGERLINIGGEKLSEVGFGWNLPSQ